MSSGGVLKQFLTHLQINSIPEKIDAMLTCKSIFYLTRIVLCRHFVEAVTPIQLFR